MSLSRVRTARLGVRSFSSTAGLSSDKKLSDLTSEAQSAQAAVKKNIKATPVREMVEGTAKAFDDNLRLLGDEFDAAVSPRDLYRGDYYKMTPQQQAAYREYRAEHLKVDEKLLNKYHEELLPGLARFQACAAQADGLDQEPIRVAVTGAAGQIGYATLFRIASGAMFGPKVPVILQLLELPGALNAANGLVMELRDCAFPTLRDVIVTDVPERAFAGVDYALLIGAQPRTKGMERGDLLHKNAEIFSIQGKALNKVAKGKDTRVLVVGNPANTNALIAASNAPNIPAANFIAMTRLDHNRALAQIAEKTKAAVDDIKGLCIWGNHSATQYPDLTRATINGKFVREIINDNDWIYKTFIPAVQQRGAAIIAARGASSAASAGGSAIDQIHDWHYGTWGNLTSSAVVSNGEYGVTKGLFYSYPVVFNHKRNWEIVRDLAIDAKSAELMEVTHKELLAERDAVAKLLPQ